MRADQIGDARDAVALQVVGDAVEQLRPDERVDEVRGADLHGRGAGDDELERVARVAMPPMPMIGIFTAWRHS